MENLNMKYVVAQTKEEAVKQFTLETAKVKDLTRKFKVGDSDLVDFVQNFSKSKDFDSSMSYVVTIDAPVADSRANPFKIMHTPTDEKRKYLMKYTLVGVNSKKIYGAKDTKADALDAARDVVRDNKESVKIEVSKAVALGNPTTAEVQYTPSVNTKPGKFLLFRSK
jgi:hypothetical protein